MTRGCLWIQLHSTCVETKINLVYEHGRSIIAMWSTNQTSSLNSRAALWNEEKLGGNPLQRISETALEDSWRKVHAIYFHCKASKTSRSITSVACTCLWIFARSFSIIRSRVSFGLVPVHFSQKFILWRHVCNTKQDFMAMSLKKIQANLQQSLQ